MLFPARACAGALLSSLLFSGGFAGAASRLDNLDRPATDVDLLNQDFGRIDRSKPVTSGWMEAVSLGHAGVNRARALNDPGLITDLVTPAARDNQLVMMSRQTRPNSSVPLPTGFSLFGAAILTLGLMSLWKGGRGQPALESGYLTEMDHGFGRPEVPPSAWFKIEVQSERGYQARHTGSARDAIDLIADLLNEGWDMVRICDRNGQAIGYDDLIDAWRDERRH